MNSGGMAELVEDGQTGGLACEPTPECVAKTIRRCLNSDVYEVLKQQCERRGSEIIGVEDYSQRILQKYNELIARR